MDVIKVDPEIMHGTPCFTGTRVPIQNLFDCLKADYSVENFLENFPTVTREQVDALLDLASHRLLDLALVR